MDEKCRLCGCIVHRNGDYAKPTILGRSHRTKHHYVAERFYGRSKNRPGTTREKIFNEDPWNIEGKYEVFCYDCHEELLHNPILLPEDIDNFSKVIAARNLNEDYKSEDRSKLGGRIKLFHEILKRGLDSILSE